MSFLLAAAITVYAIGAVFAFIGGFIHLDTAVDDRDRRHGLGLVKGGFLIWPVIVVIRAVQVIRDAEEALK